MIYEQHAYTYKQNPPKGVLSCNDLMTMGDSIKKAKRQ